MPTDRGRINIDMFAARLQPAASRLLTPQSREVDAIVRKASRGGTSLRVEETVGVLSRERYERPADISRETIQEQALAVAGGGGGSGGAGGPILSFPPIIRDGATNNTTTSTTGIAVMAGNVTIPDDGREYDLIAIGEQSFGNFGSPAGYGEMRLGGKASGWVGGSGSAWRGWAHTVVNGPYTNTTVSVTFWVKTDSGTLTYGGGRIDLFAIPRGGAGGGTWNGGDVTLPTRFKDVTVSGRDATDSQMWAIAPTGRMDLEELFATRGLNIGADGIIIARNASNATMFRVDGVSGNTFIGGPLEVDGGTSFDGSVTLRAGANVFAQRVDGSQAARLDPTTGQLSFRDTSNLLRMVLFGPSGQFALYGTDGSTINVLLSGNGTARFLSAPTVGPVGATKRVLTEDDLGAGTGGLTTEQVDDRVAALIVAGAGITKTYDDTANTLTLAATGGGAGTRDYPITYVSATAPVEPRVGDFWYETSTPRPPSDDPHASLTVSATAPASPSLGDFWYQP